MTLTKTQRRAAFWRGFKTVIPYPLLFFTLIMVAVLVAMIGCSSHSAPVAREKQTCPGGVCPKQAAPDTTFSPMPKDRSVMDDPRLKM